MTTYSNFERELGDVIAKHLWCGCRDRGGTSFNPRHAAREAIKAVLAAQATVTTPRPDADDSPRINT